MNELANGIQKTASTMALYEGNESALFAAVNDIPKSDIDDLVKQYSRVVDNFRPVNLLRYELLNQLKEGNKLSSSVYEDVKEKIRTKDSAYFLKYGTTLTESLVQYPNKKKNWFTAWKNPFRVLYVFIYRDKLKSDIEGALQKFSEEIENRLDLNNFSSNRVGFDGTANFGSSYCWLAFYPNTKLNHQRAYQLFLKISGDQFEAGLMPGWKIQEPEAQDVKRFDDIESALLHLRAVKNKVVELNQRLRNYWKFAPGQHAVKWEEFCREGIMAISWKEANLKDLRTYSSTEALAEALGVEDPENSNEVFNIENFRDASIGDIVIANRGKREAIGIGVIKGAYEYHPEKNDFSHVRKVNWLVTKPIPVAKSFRPDTFSPTKEWNTVKGLYISKYPELADTIKQLERERGLSSEEKVSPPTIDATNEREPEYNIEECAKIIGYSTEKIASWISAIERKKQAVFYGPPGTGKTFIASHLARHIVGGTDGIMDCIQFHPAYTYEEFIQGICPHADDKGNLQFDLKPGRFLEFCAKARQRTGPCVLIIDEINRANIARVFGELMYLLEYRERDMPLAGGIRFSMPNNVLIIGTMNTADRSIALVDFALRRRFAFLELSPEYYILEAFQRRRGFDAGGLVRALLEVNTKINDKQYYLGISFFMVDDLAKKLEEIWRMEIETYLEEYFFSQPEVMNNFCWDRMRGKILP
jgi:MoxR-like ATPase